MEKAQHKVWRRAMTFSVQNFWFTNLQIRANVDVFSCLDREKNRENGGDMINSGEKIERDHCNNNVF